MVAFRPEESAAEEQWRPAIDLQESLPSGREGTPASASTFNAIATEDMLQGRITLSGHQRRNLNSSKHPLPPPRRHEEIGRKSDSISRSGRPPSGLLMELPADPLTSFCLHQGEEAGAYSNDHRALPVHVDGKLTHGKKPKQTSKPTATAN